MRSKFETRVASFLKGKRCSFTYEEETWEYETSPSGKMMRCGECGSTNLLVIKRYTPDFFLSNGIVIEAKGRWTAENRRVALCFPEVKLLFMRNNTLSKRSKTKYSDYCDKNGLDYHVSYLGEVPNKWLL
jgi:hypothetical protein